MKYFDEYKNKKLCQSILRRIKELTKEEINIMEVCGTHTRVIFSSGIKSLLPENIHLISGPGCPVCVTPLTEINHIIALSKMDNTIIATFGDMVRVPGSTSSLKKEKAKGADIRIVYSPLQALEIANEYPDKRVILIGVGFETTAPLLASVVLEARERLISNFYLLSLCKLMPPVIKTLLDSREVNIDGMLCPGHVSAIIGTDPYKFIPECYGISCVIAGFEPVDILRAIFHLIIQKVEKAPKVENKYSRAVRETGNPTALNMVYRVFKQIDSQWRGLGTIVQSGLDLRPEFSDFNARNYFIEIEEVAEDTSCRCGDVLRGVISPLECPLFGKACTPSSPIGSCMVSSEGTCAAYYQYNQK